MMTLPFFRPVLFRAPDAGGGMGEGTAPNTEPAQEPGKEKAALAGVAKECIPYVPKLADTGSIVLDANDAGEKIEAAIDKVLADLPELRGGAGGTGSAENFARKTGEAEDL